MKGKAVDIAAYQTSRGVAQHRQNDAGKQAARVYTTPPLQPPPLLYPFRPAPPPAIPRPPIFFSTLYDRLRYYLPR
jgi:hypothetical protein